MVVRILSRELNDRAYILVRRRGQRRLKNKRSNPSQSEVNVCGITGIITVTWKKILETEQGLLN